MAHSRRSRALLALSIATLVWTSSLSAQRVRPVRRPATGVPIAQIDAIIDSARADHAIPGVQVAIGFPDGSTFEESWGWFSIGDLERMRTDTILQVGSLTKQVTCAAVLRLAERNALSIDDDIDQYITELEPRSFGVTIRQLMSHTSGLPNYLELSLDPWEPITHDEVIDWVLAQPVRAAPGAMWEYSNIGYYLLGVIIERVSGMTYAEFLEQELLLPLGLSETAYCGRPPATDIPNGYLGSSGFALPIEAMDMTIPFAAGALCSTAEDMVRWNRALVSGMAVSMSSYAAMTTPGQLESGALTGYGFGLNVDEVEGYTVISHSGTIPGFNAHLLYVKEANVTVAVLTNLFPLDGNFASGIARDIAGLLVPVASSSAIGLSDEGRKNHFFIPVTPNQ